MIRKFNLEFDKEKLPLLVKEAEYDYIEKKVNTPERIAACLNSCVGLNRQCEEYVYLLTFNQAMTQPVNLFQVGHGGVTCCYIDTREVIQRALLSGAVNIVIAHNHPSGNIKPSDEDCKICKRLWSACEIMGLKLLDFLIIAEENFYSFAANGWLDLH